VFLVNLSDLGPLGVSPFQKRGTRIRFSPITSHFSPKAVWGES
jgi:hypothetical protein